MTDILTEGADCPPIPKAVTFDDFVPDDLNVGDIVFFDGNPYCYLYKDDGPAPLFFRSSLGDNHLIEMTSTDYVHRISTGSARRPGQKAAPPTDTADRSFEADVVYPALPPEARRRSTLLDYYVEEFRHRIDEAAATDQPFHRNKENARIVLTVVDRALAAEGIDPPPRRSATSLLRWLKTSDDRGSSPAANVHGNYLRRYRRKVPQRLIDEIAITIRKVVGEFPHMPPNKIRNIANKKIEDINAKEGLNLPEISIDLFNSEFNHFDAWVREAAANGVHQADLQFGAVGKLTRPTRINQLWELDHHEIDLIPILGSSTIKDLFSATPLGRLGITVAYDVYSAYPMGIYISFEKTGLLPALMCVAHGVQAKTYIAERFPEIDGILLGFGKPVTIRFDRAPEFVSRQMATALRRVGIGFELARPHFPDDKPYVERFLGTFESNLITWLKGRTGSSVQKRGDADPMKEARIELDDVVRLIHEFLITCYARTPQQGLDYDTPEQRWIRGRKAFSPRVLSPEEQAPIDNIASMEVDVKAGRNGIRWQNKFYQSGELQVLRRQSGDHGFRKSQMTPLVGRVSLRDLGTMYVSVPNARPPREIAIPCTNKFVHGRTLWQDDVIRSLLNVKRKRATSTSAYEQAFEALFVRSLGYMGVAADGAPKPSQSRSAVTAARFVGVLVDGAPEHALSRVVRDAVNLDLFKEVENQDRAAAQDQSSPNTRKKPVVVDDILDFDVDEIDIDDVISARA